MPEAELLQLSAILELHTSNFKAVAFAAYVGFLSFPEPVNHRMRPPYAPASRSIENLALLPTYAVPIDTLPVRFSRNMKHHIGFHGARLCRARTANPPSRNYRLLNLLEPCQL